MRWVRSRIFMALLLFQKNHQGGEVGGRDARDAPCLSERTGTDGGELFPRLEPQAVDAGIVKLLGQQAALEPRKLLDLSHLAADVALVLHGDLHLLGDVAGEGGTLRIKGGEVGVVDLGPAQQGDEGTAVGDVGGALFCQERRKRRRGGGAGVCLLYTSPSPRDA